MLNSRINNIFEKINNLVKCKNVKFSIPPLNSDTTIYTPSKYAIGGFRHHGEWISSFIDINKILKKENIDFNVFLSTKIGKSFIKSLTDRVYSLKANDIYEILLTLSIYKTRIDDLESIILRELEDSLDELNIFQLLELPNLINNMDERFLEKLKKVKDKNTNNSNNIDSKDNKEEIKNDLYYKILNKLENGYKRKLSLNHS